MALFEKSISIPEEKVAEIALANWNLLLGDRLKASQNHTFAATFLSSETVFPSSSEITSFNSVKAAVRVTPDPHGKHFLRIKQEIHFVNYLKFHKLYHVCAPLVSLNGDYIIQDNGLVIVAFEWAKGDPINFMDYTWMTN
jgi:hypothetical protein